MRSHLSKTLALLAAAIMSATVTSAQVPRGVLAEDGTATWCVYCPYAYAGLEVMKSRYDATEFTSVRYYATSGGLGTTETNARIAYYNMTGFPTVVFDGKDAVVGADSGTSDGSPYDPLVAGGIGVPSPLKITVNSVDLVQPSGSVDFDVEVMENIADIGNVKIRALIMENDCTYASKTYTDVTRDILPDVALSVSSLGQVQHVSATFAVDPLWKTPDLWMAFFIQDDDDKSVWQSASTRPAPPYSIRYWSKGTRAKVVGSNSATFEFQDFAVFNLGSNPDVIRATLTPGSAPAGWGFMLTDGTNDYASFVDLALSPGQGTVLRVRVTPGSAGYAFPKVVLTSPNLPSVTREIAYNVITDDVDVLLVDDDGGESYDQYHTDAIGAAGKSVGVWDAALASVSSLDLANFPIVVWQTGLSYPTLRPTDRAALSAYLDGGGRLLLTGQDIGWELNDQGGDAITWYHNYLKANFVSDDSNINTATGVAGDPISDGIVLSLAGGDGANNNVYPDCVTPFDATASVIFTYSASLKAALKVDTGVYRVVYLAFPYESISTQANRRLLTSRALTWLGATSTDAESGPFAAGDLRIRALPNPTTGSTALAYQLPRSADVRVALYAADGSLVRVVAEGPQAAGSHVARWDGRDGMGRPAASGAYFYRLRAGDREESGKLVLTR